MQTPCFGSRDNKCSVGGAESAEGCVFFSVCPVEGEWAI